MEEEIKQVLIENFKNAVDTQARICLELDINWNIWETIYTEKDLFNASLVFIHIMWNISAWHCLNNLQLDLDQASMIATESWENIRQTILMATGLDMHLVAKK